MVFAAPSDVAVRPSINAPRVSRHGNRTVLWLEGEHDMATVAVMSDVLAAAIASDDADVIVDLSGVTFIGAATFGALIVGRNLLAQQSRRMTVRSPSAYAQRLLELFELTDLVESEGDVAC